MEPRIWKTGEPCRIKCGGRTVDGRITLASPNGKSLAIEFEAVLDPGGTGGGYAGAMALTWNGQSFEDLFGRGTVELGDVPK